MSVAKLESITNEAATIAMAASLIPSPATPALMAFSILEPLGVDVVNGFIALFHKIHKSKNPTQAAQKVLSISNPAVDEIGYIDTIDPDGEGRDV